jgi:hypothetical protein
MPRSHWKKPLRAADRMPLRLSVIIRNNFRKTFMPADFRQDFIRFAIEERVLHFGEFKTKAGRMSPYFFNAGLFNHGVALKKLAQFYAMAIGASGVEYDMLFGPAYKGIPLVAAVSIALADTGRDVPYAFDRKEAKDHGEGGAVIVAPLAGGAGDLLRPVDSEHCALWQCLVGERLEDVSRVAITASGGPFRERALSELAAVTADEALRHPTWKMGPKGPEPDMGRMLSGHPESMQLPPAPQPSGPWIVSAAATNTAWSGPWGVSFTANLTPDAETGLGKWTQANFTQTIRTGRHMGRGRAILPPMPIPMYKHFTDADLEAIFTYLKSIPPVKNRVPEPIGSVAKVAAK